MNLLNTHYYDGKLQERIKVIEPEIAECRETPRDVKLMAFDWLWEKISRHPYASFNAKRCFDAIYTTFKNGNPGNFDPANGLYADDLLLMCYRRINTPFQKLVQLLLDADDVKKDRVVYVRFVKSGVCYECPAKANSWHFYYFPYFENEVLSLIHGRVASAQNEDDWYGMIEAFSSCSEHSSDDDEDIDLCECDAYRADAEEIRKDLQTAVIVLPDIAQKILAGVKLPVEDFFNALLAQLDEMASGLCPQGRTTRLLQILVSYENEPEK